MVFASEAAAAAFLNPFRHPVLVAESMFKRFDHGAVFERAHCALFSADDAPSAVQVGPVADKVDHLAQSSEPLRNLLKVKVDTVVQNAAQGRCSVETSVKRATKELEVAIEQCPVLKQACKDTDQVIAEELHQFVVQKVQCQYGTAREPETVRRMAATENNAVFEKKILFEDRTAKVWVGGRIDGMVGTELIEIKNRKAKFFVPLPLYDVAQVHCYMHIKGLRRATLVEQLGDQTKETSIKWDDGLWKKLLGGLRIFCRKFCILINDEAHQQALLGCRTLQEKAVWWKSLA